MKQQHNHGDQWVTVVGQAKVLSRLQNQGVNVLLRKLYMKLKDNTVSQSGRLKSDKDV
jgi:hypothetical protein